MSDDLEKQLRQLLRPVDPGEELTRRIMARVDEERGARAAARSARADGLAPADRLAAADRSAQAARLARAARRPVWRYAALAASIVLVTLGLTVHERQQRQRQAGLEARAQVLAALHVTSEKLDLAYRLVNNGPAR